jgi:FkbM family methyltransferase
MKQIINRYLRKFGVELHGTGYLQSLAKGEFKKDAFAVQKELSGKRPVNMIFDVGANRGDITAKYLELFPSATIHGFEPFPGTFDVFRETFENKGAVHCHSLAVSDSERVTQLYVNRNVDTNSLLKPKDTGLSSDVQVENKSIIDIRTTTLDLFCSQNKIDRIDILKLDIQGGELGALRGAEQLLKESRIGLIYSETYFVEQYEAQPLFHDISSYLHTFGFYLQDIYSPIYGNGNLAWADVIFRKAGE